MLKNIRKALVFVESPFQMTNLMDLAKYQPSIQFNVIARLNGERKNDDAVLRIVNAHKFSNVSVRLIKISRKGKNKKIEMLRLVPFIPSVLSESYVIFYDDRSLFYKVFKRMVRGSIIFADDGAYSFIKLVKLESKRDKRIKGFITRFDGLKSDLIEVIHVPYDSIELKTADYSIVIGMPLSEKGIISKEDHLKVISLLFNKAKAYTGDNCYYFPHRSENMYRRLDFPIIDSELSVEEYLASNAGNAPSHVISMYSTALFVISARFSGPVCYYFRLPDSIINDVVHVENIKTVYKALDKSSCKELL